MNDMGMNLNLHNEKSVKKIVIETYGKKEKTDIEKKRFRELISLR